jgi:hypothetical protein
VLKSLFPTAGAPSRREPELLTGTSKQPLQALDQQQLFAVSGRKQPNSGAEGYPT